MSKRTIRRNVFETNSSSMHSLSIVGSDRLYNPINKDTVIYYGEFGWGYEELTSPEDKLSYLITQYNDDESKLEMIKSAFKKHTGFEMIIADMRGGYWEKGYIDHQSQGMICEYITDEQSVINLVFNQSNVIIVDNDNH